MDKLKILKEIAIICIVFTYCIFYNNRLFLHKVKRIYL